MAALAAEAANAVKSGTVVLTGNNKKRIQKMPLISDYSVFKTLNEIKTLINDGSYFDHRIHHLSGIAEKIWDDNVQYTRLCHWFDEDLFDFALFLVKIRHTDSRQVCFLVCEFFFSFFFVFFCFVWFVFGLVQQPSSYTA